MRLCGCCFASNRLGARLDGKAKLTPARDGAALHGAVARDDGITKIVSGVVGKSFMRIVESIGADTVVGVGA